ncbi:4125_t:CDS:1, partial [Gigaspora rosea]
NAFNSQDLNILKQVIENFGQFVPTVIIFGERLHYEVTKVTKVTTNTKSLSVFIQSGTEYAIMLQNSLIFGSDKIKMLQGKEDVFFTRNKTLGYNRIS